nr:MAG TPA: Protein of unknown function (DUF2681) [Caudoviricetes sp.]DAU49407.1 MAG TPA: Protein of unknown function (DUF2681) [Caudoviricetes sp.]
MTNLTLLGALGALVLAIIACVYWQIRKIKVRAKNLAIANAELTTQNHQLKTEKAVVEQQVKNYKVKQKNDETTHSLDRDAVISELRQNDDLRAE